MKKQFVLAALAALCLSLPAFATDYDVDAEHSNVNFTVSHLISKVSGAFKEFSGTYSFDEKKPADAKVNFTVQAKSVDTGSAKRDGHLQSEDFFFVEKNPTFTFVSKKVKAAGKNKFKVEGDLTMRGVTKPATFDVEYLGAAADFAKNMRTGFTASTKVNRKDFGINWSKTLDTGGVVVGNDVTINLQIEGVAKGAK